MDENAMLRELVSKLVRALSVGGGWCSADCADEFACNLEGDCPLEKLMKELEIEVAK